MAVTYDNVAFGRIEETLKQYVDNEFQNVYISPKFVDKGSEFIRINLLSSTNEETSNAYEIREYAVLLRYYHKCDISNIKINEAVKKKSDRLKKHLLDKQTNSDSWAELSVDTITYNVQDDENADKDNLYIIEYTLTMTNYNHFN
tara:strand:- start:11649 stop:12083 length:435 start_codon:yes stop_codon:yes gene_type:complete